jgi:hypothetical protein
MKGAKLKYESESQMHPNTALNSTIPTHNNKNNKKKKEVPNYKF